MLDRDGVINYDSKDYIKSPDEWRPIPDSLTALALLSHAGYKVGVATNQSGIAREYYSELTLANIHNKMMQNVEGAGGTIDKIVYCPHMPDAGCNCRKPKPGMLFELANFFGSNPAKRYYIGDRVSDLEAAEACGAIPLLIKSPMSTFSESDYEHVSKFDSLLCAVNFIINE